MKSISLYVVDTTGWDFPKRHLGIFEYFVDACNPAGILVMPAEGFLHGTHGCLTPLLAICTRWTCRSTDFVPRASTVSVANHPRRHHLEGELCKDRFTMQVLLTCA
jgi:hypothetical protein